MCIRDRHDDASSVQQSTAAVLTLFGVASWVLVVIARPYVWWKIVLVATMISLFLPAVLWDVGKEFWALDAGHTDSVVLALTVAAVAAVLVELCAWVNNRSLRADRGIRS